MCQKRDNLLHLLTAPHTHSPLSLSLSLSLSVSLSPPPLSPRYYPGQAVYFTTTSARDDIVPVHERDRIGPGVYDIQGTFATTSHNAYIASRIAAVPKF